MKKGNFKFFYEVIYYTFTNRWIYTYVTYFRLDDYKVTDSTAPFIFFHWWYIDIFVYFSHNFITIPPVGWINQAHMHGVIVLGW